MPTNIEKVSKLEALKNKPQELELEQAEHVIEYPNFEDQRNLDQLASELDPLGLDVFFSTTFTQQDPNKVDYLVGTTVKTCSKILKFNNLSLPEAYAIQRDLGMLGASLTKLNYDVSKIKTFSEASLKISEITKEVPRDTVFSYGPRNPEGPRQRKFDDNISEPLFIESFKHGMENLDVSIACLIKLTNLDPNTAEFKVIMDRANENFNNMISGIGSVRRSISAEEFTGNIRPFFDPYKIAGVKYNAPGGAGMPIMILDKLLWRNPDNEQNGEYTDYYKDNLAYLPSSYRELDKGLSCPTVLEKLKGSQQNTSENYINSLEATLNFATAILAFRAKHKVVADKNFSIRKEGEVGSGGHTPLILQELVDKTFGLKKELEELIKNAYANQQQ